MKLTLTYSDQSTVTLATKPAAQYYRIPNDTERININEPYNDFRYRGDNGGEVRDVVTRTGARLPEVYLLQGDLHTIADCAVQWLWRHINPDLTDNSWSAMMDDSWAFMNNTGTPGKRNCITGESATAPFPKFDKPRVCGGALLQGVEDDVILWIETILVSNLPTAEEVLATRHLWYWGTSIDAKGKIDYIRKMGNDGFMHPVRIPLITTNPVWLYLDELHKLPAGFIPPSPLWMP